MERKEKLRTEWEKRIDDLKTSGLTQRKWCEKNGYKFHQLKYSLKTFGSKAKNAEINSGEKGSLIIIRIGKCEINLEPDFDAELFKKIVKVLFELC